MERGSRNKPTISDSPSRKLVWAYARGVPYGEVPDWLAESLRGAFPQVHSIVTSDGETQTVFRFTLPAVKDTGSNDG